MTVFRYMAGVVYILENSEANRVKIGMTINDVNGRLQDVNEKWLGEKASCQICGGRRNVGSDGNIPTHVLSGIRCQGSDSLPFEKDSALAESYLEELKESLKGISGVQLNSTLRKITTLEKRIEQFRKFDQLVGQWRVNTVYFTKCAEDVELRSHEILAGHLDNSVPFGEVFRCSVIEAANAVELVLKQLNLFDSAKKVVMST